MKIKLLIEELQKQGWVLDRIRGSHHVFVHFDAVRPVVVPVHNKEIPDFYAKGILRQAKGSLSKGAR
ncbi:MAG: type II toxin-antitoxin system HicA family toxin [Deltaproteobacteria bacterium]|nr:type II toxin-antitoxin system HicA family toxin [Deltaproteobacteria bacterium]